MNELCFIVVVLNLNSFLIIDFNKQKASSKCARQMLFLDYSNLQERRIISKLRRCYIRRNISGMSRRHHIRKFCFSDVFLK